MFVRLFASLLLSGLFWVGSAAAQYIVLQPATGVAAPAPVITTAPVTSVAPAVTAYRPAVTAAPAVTAYRPAVTAAPAVTAYRPAVTAAPVTAYRPSTTVSVMTGRPVAAAPVVVRPKVYVPGRPLYNLFQAITP
ncbi:hypothetical protein [Roseimaritima sediminicola]|uniref:hypothetical protein n=1 Tax=Roseimaritima sediminicola TaxID=2662066 RepID=UPI00129853EB|nr:hypothetical protein [Roseimaritima sediminicola]